jgi:hypothetical protein
LIVGLVAAGAGYRGAFGAGAAFAAVGFVGLAVHAGRRRSRRVSAGELGVLATGHPTP